MVQGPGCISSHPAVCLPSATSSPPAHPAIDVQRWTGCTGGSWSGGSPPAASSQHPTSPAQWRRRQRAASRGHCTLRDGVRPLALIHAFQSISPCYVVERIQARQVLQSALLSRGAAGRHLSGGLSAVKCGCGAHRPVRPVIAHCPDRGLLSPASCLLSFGAAGAAAGPQAPPSEHHPHAWSPSEQQPRSGRLRDPAAAALPPLPPSPPPRSSTLQPWRRRWAPCWQAAQ